MKSKLLTASFLILAALQVACSDDDKGLTQAQMCAKDPACWQRYTSPQAVKAIAGPAAVAGLPQVANATQGTNIPPNQVPDPKTVLPASISNQDLAKYAQRVNNTIQAMNADPDFHLLNGSHTLLPADYVLPASTASSSSGAEITVARVQPAEPQQQRQPAASAASQEPDPNSVFSQPEALGAR